MSVEELMKLHFEDDKKAFDKINKSLESLEKMLAKQNEDSSLYRDSMKAHIERVEPMISSYETNSIVSKANGEFITKWGGRIVWLSVLIGAIYAVREFFIRFLLK